MTSPSLPPALWVTMRGAPSELLAQWCGWAIGAVVAAVLGATWWGPSGPIVVVLVGGWWFARRMGTPVDVLRRFHVDDDEVLALGPGRGVCRLTWAQVERVTQERHALVLSGDGRTVALPLEGFLRTGAWDRVLARVVPNLAADLWERLEAGSVRLVPHVDPPALSLLWWAYVPAALVCAATADHTALLVAVGLASMERVIAWLHGRARACVLQPAGIALRGPQGRLFVPWAQALVTSASDGLGVAVPGHDPGIVPSGAPSFLAAAAVIELRAQLGPNYAADVNFRVRFENGGISVVGEVESLH